MPICGTPFAIMNVWNDVYCKSMFLFYDYWSHTFITWLLAVHALSFITLFIVFFPFFLLSSLRFLAAVCLVHLLWVLCENSHKIISRYFYYYKVIRKEWNSRVALWKGASIELNMQKFLMNFKHTKEAAIHSPPSNKLSPFFFIFFSTFYSREIFPLTPRLNACVRAWFLKENPFPHSHLYFLFRMEISDLLCRFPSLHKNLLYDIEKSL